MQYAARWPTIPLVFAPWPITSLVFAAFAFAFASACVLSMHRILVADDVRTALFPSKISGDWLYCGSIVGMPLPLAPGSRPGPSSPIGLEP